MGSKPKFSNTEAHTLNQQNPQSLITCFNLQQENSIILFILNFCMKMILHYFNALENPIR